MSRPIICTLAALAGSPACAVENPLVYIGTHQSGNRAIDEQTGLEAFEFGFGAWDIQLGPDRLLYVAPKGLHRIDVYDPRTGAFVREFASFSGTCYGMAFSSNGERLYVADYSSAQFRVYRVADRTLENVYDAPGGNKPERLAIGPDGYIYVTWGVRCGSACTEPPLSRIPEGAPLNSTSQWQTVLSTQHPIQLWDVTFDCNGQLWVTIEDNGAGHRIERVTGIGSSALVHQFEVGEVGAQYGVDFAPDGTVLVIHETDTGAGYFELDPNTGDVLDTIEIDGLDVLRSILGTPNAADLAWPWRVLNFSDVVAFLEAFGDQEPEADLAEPLGQFDFSDVVAFLSMFALGC